MALMQITIIPLGTGDTSVGVHVAEVQRFLERSGARFTLTDMGTVIEGEAAELFFLAASIHQIPFQRGVQRVVTQISVDDRRDKPRALGEKRQAVLDRLHTHEN